MSNADADDCKSATSRSPRPSPRLAPRGEALAAQACNLERFPQVFSRRIDAPMSSGARRIGQTGQDEWIQFPDDIALEAAMGFLFRHAFLRPAFNVFPRPGISAHSHHGDGPQGVICRTISAPVQATPDRFARRSLQRTCATKGCQCSFAFQAFRVVTCNDNQNRSGLRPDTESFPQPLGMLTGRPSSMPSRVLSSSSSANQRVASRRRVAVKVCSMGVSR